MQSEDIKCIYLGHMFNKIIYNYILYKVILKEKNEDSVNNLLQLKHTVIQMLRKVCLQILLCALIARSLYDSKIYEEKFV